MPLDLMNKKWNRALFIFRRDLRLEDNTGLIFALENAKEVLPCFIFTPEQIDQNPYRSDHALQFMIESLEELQAALQKHQKKLYLFYGQIEKVVAECIEKLQVSAVVVNRDYTPYSVQRDRNIQAICEKSALPFHSFDDLLLHPPEESLKSDGKPYSIFTPFFRNASKIEVAHPVSNPHFNYYASTVSFACPKSVFDQILPHRPLPHSGGRTAGLNILKTLKNYSQYDSLRDFPAKEATTHLSAHLKFTTCSVREVYWALHNQLGVSSELVRSLYWRDFFSCIAFYFPQIFSGAFHSKFDQLEWENDEELFNRWCQGTTGFPLVDAGMRELNQTGFMHNRVRMLTASFLIKDLHIDWRWGEKYFAQKLIDYDPAVNNGNWQWAASTGCDAQPYFRLFNPWTQAAKFDPECQYIKQWVPELSMLSPKILHRWNLEKHRPQSCTYPSPLVNHTEASRIALTAYKKIGRLKK